jgi:hypothetical protein
LPAKIGKINILPCLPEQTKQKAPVFLQIKSELAKYLNG